MLTANDLERIDRTPKFIFANACQSGVLPSRPDLSSPELPAAFAEAFFKKGVANYICTAWPVGDDAALQFCPRTLHLFAGRRDRSAGDVRGHEAGPPQDCCHQYLGRLPALWQPQLPPAARVKLGPNRW